MTLLRILLVFLLFGMTSSVWAALASPPATQAWLDAHRHVVVATYAEGYAPFESTRDGHVDGLGPDYLRELARRLGLDVSFRVYADWPAALAAARSGEANLLMNVAPTPDRTDRLLLSEPYFESSPVLAVRSGDTRIVQFGDLRGGIVAVQPGHAEDDAMARYMPDVRVMHATSMADGLHRVADNRADAMIGPPETLRHAIDDAGLAESLRLGPPVPLPIASLSFATAAGTGRATLIHALDDALATLTPSDHARLRAPWVGGDPGRFAIDTAVPLTSAERAWLARLPPLRIGIDPTAAPVSLLGRDGRAEGMAVDFLREATRALGLRTTVVPTSNWTETVRRAAAGDIDILPAASPLNDELGRRFDFSVPYAEFPIMIVTRTDFATIAAPEDLAGRTVAANLASRAVALAVERLPMVHVIAVSRNDEGLATVAEGRADAYLGDIATTEFAMRRDYPTRLKLAAPTGERAELAIAVDRQYAPLLPLLNRVLTRLSDRRTQDIRNTWLRSEYTWGGSWAEILRKVGPAGFIVLVLLLAITHAYIRLRRETRRRRVTEEQLADVTRHIPAVVYRFRYHAEKGIAFVYVGGNPLPIFGVPAETFLHDEARAFARVDARDQGPLLAEVARAASTLTPIHAVMRIRDAEPERWVASHALPRVRDDVVEFTGYWIDITQQRQQESQLAEARDTAESATRAKSRFLATMSHEIRTPMNGVLGMLELLDDTPLNAEQKRLLGTAGTSAEALLQILDDILDFSRIEADRLEVERAPVDLRRLVESAIDLFAHQATRKGLALTASVDERVAGELVTDGARLRQVLLNLVSNAIKFTSTGRVDLRLAVIDDDGVRQRLRFTVEDTGIGIAPEHRERLFEPFVQAQSSTTRRFGGSGLGLAISRRLVELLGGRIEIASQPGQGTRLDVTLDMAVRRRQVPAAADTPTCPAGDTRMSPSRDILVAEDNPTNRTVIAAQLERLGHRATIVDNGAVALARLDTAPFDLVLTDVHMPVLDGYDLARALRERGSRVRIVAMTAHAMPGERERCLAAGMDDFVAKPIAMSALREVIGRVPPRPDDAITWNLDELAETFGDPALLQQLVDRFEAACREDIALAGSLRTPPDAANWVHRIAGGMRLFGESPEATMAEALEDALRGPDAERHMADVAPFIQALEGYLLRLRDAVDRRKKMDFSDSSDSLSPTPPTCSSDAPALARGERP